MTAPEHLARTSPRVLSDRRMAAGFRMQADVVDIICELAGEDYFTQDPVAWLTKFAADLRAVADTYAPEEQAT